MRPDAPSPQPLRQVLWLAALPPVALALGYVAAALGDLQPLKDALATGPSAAALVAAGAKVDALVAGGELERLVLSPFLHAGPTHLLSNAVWLGALAVMVGRLQRPADAAPVVFAVWIWAAIAGQALSTAASAGPSVGASGAIFGLLAFAPTAALRARRADLRPWVQVSLAAAAAALLLLVATVTLSTHGVDHAAHLGGALAGLGLALTTPRTLRRLAALALGVVLAAAVAAGVRPPASGPLPDATRPCDVAGAELPATGTPGRLVGAACVADATPWQGLDCQQVPFELLAVAGPVTALEEAFPDLAGRLRPGAPCVRFTRPGENVLMVRVDASRAVALAATRAAWPRLSALRRRLSAGRCPGS